MREFLGAGGGKKRKNGSQTEKVLPALPYLCMPNL